MTQPEAIDNFAGDVPLGEIEKETGRTKLSGRGNGGTVASSMSKMPRQLPSTDDDQGLKKAISDALYVQDGTITRRQRSCKLNEVIADSQ
jgi:hypothetical protein